MPIYSSIFGQMGVGIGVKTVKTSIIFQLNRVWYQEYLFSIVTEFFKDFDRKMNMALILPY